MDFLNSRICGVVINILRAYFALFPNPARFEPPCAAVAKSVWRGAFGEKAVSRYCVVLAMKLFHVGLIATLAILCSGEECSRYRRQEMVCCERSDGSVYQAYTPCECSCGQGTVLRADLAQCGGPTTAPISYESIA